ncbi:hypothetical protein KDK_71640 [Dictyobacter kobayashii]|uniref:histidine kinase n=2 Tax=Dictyobacter kobayashii TaxID=2014872 RepID=A0A402AWB0_9CHLR|nr:hypothetical protein KDK_71640 [Dictyobacter kobayashii]
MESDHRSSKTQDLTPSEQSVYTPNNNTDLFLALAHDSADIYWLLTPAGDFHATDCSNWKTFVGDKFSAQYQGWLDCVHPADRAGAQSAFEQAIQSHQATEIEARMRRYDGMYRLIRLHFVPVRDAQGNKLDQIISYGKDITEQKHYQHMSEEQMRLAVGAANIGLWDWDIRTNHLTLNDQCKILFGFPSQNTVSYEQLMGLFFQRI